MGRRLNFTTEELKDIIHRYYRSEYNKNQFSISFSDVAKYAKERLGIKNIQYYHFSRNIEINEMVSKYNKDVKANNIQYNNDESYLINLDINEFVNNNLNNRKDLIFFLTRQQEIQKKLYDQDIDHKYMIKKLEEKLIGEQNKKENYRNKMNNLKNENELLKNENKLLKNTLQEYEEKEEISALNSTKIFDIDFKNKDKYNENIRNFNDDNGANLEKFFEKYEDIFGEE